MASGLHVSLKLRVIACAGTEVSECELNQDKYDVSISSVQGAQHPCFTIERYVGGSASPCLWTMHTSLVYSI